MSDDDGAPVPGGPGRTSMPPTPGGGGGRVADDRAAALVAYLEANRGRYTDEALRRAATSVGYTEAEVDAAQVSVASGPPITPDQGLRARARMAVAIPVAILYVVGAYLVAGLLGSRAQNDLTLPAFLVVAIAGLVGWALLRERRPSLALGLGLGVILAVVLPVVLFLVLLGMCIVAGGTPFGLTGG